MCDPSHIARAAGPRRVSDSTARWMGAPSPTSDPGRSGWWYAAPSHLHHPSGTFLVRHDEAAGVDRATGIRYARAERFARPEPVRHTPQEWVEATTWAPACPQPPDALPAGLVTDPMGGLGYDEHCQALSVTVPPGTRAGAGCRSWSWCTAGPTSSAPVTRHDRHTPPLPDPLGLGGLTPARGYAVARGRGAGPGAAHAVGRLRAHRRAAGGDSGLAARRGLSAPRTGRSRCPRTGMSRAPHPG